MKTPGRNEPCPCGSGKKYKKCHGSVHQIEQVNAHFAKLAERAEATRVQRERQQGYGRPIVSADLNGRRIVAIKNRLMHSMGWATFHDFLFDYIKMAFGPGWGNAEIATPVEHRHPVIIWYQKMSVYLQSSIKEKGKVHDAAMTGAVGAYLFLAYDLYALEHNAQLQEKLLARLRDHEQFSGARYEVYVAATFIRAGFDIEFENEDDRHTSHCEFTATHRRTGKRFSVEAKRREGAKVRVGHLFNSALRKQANHDRVIFIDINVADNAGESRHAPYLDHAFRVLRSFEGKELNDNPRPPAYVFISNTPWEHFLDTASPACVVQIDGFQIPDFKGDKQGTLREVIDAREAHREIHDLMLSIQDHTTVPATFDGEIPEYAFNKELHRIVVGQRYMVKDQEGVERPATLISATVTESEKLAWCSMTFDDGTSFISKLPLSDREIQVWRKYPDTFFGQLGQRKTRVNGPLEMYDFLMESFGKSDKETLLKNMAHHPDIGELALLDQSRLASIYAERMTYGMLNHADSNKKPDEK